MKGYTIITQDDILTVTGKNARARAIKKAKQLQESGDNSVFVQAFDDSNSDGYCCEMETIYI